MRSWRKRRNELANAVNRVANDGGDPEPRSREENPAADELNAAMRSPWARTGNLSRW
jgi:hypothetical protein